MEIRLISTRDGSDSFYVPALDETYHSKHGAIQESQHVFIANGLEYYVDQVESQKVDILEFGFGTGLNALLTFKAKPDFNISYHSLEKYPIKQVLANQLNYGKILERSELFKKILVSPWGTWHELTDNHSLLKEEIDFVDFEPESSYDLIYFDAFAPSKQPELWSVEILRKCYDALKNGGAFVTYSAKGQLRRDLESLGFTVERLPGPPGKAEMLRARKF